jgi:hypothetical protein
MESETKPLNITRIFSIFSIYLLVVGILYLFSFWSNFDVNIFEYLALSDVIKITLIPIGSIFIIIIIGEIFHNLTDNKFSLFSALEEVSNVESVQKPVGIIKEYKNIILLIGCIVFIKYPFIWIFFAIFLVLDITILIAESNLLPSISDENARIYTLYFLILLPFLSIAVGQDNARKILYGDKYKYIILETQDIKLKVLGHAGSYNFFISEDNKEIVIIDDSKLYPVNIYSAEND